MSDARFRYTDRHGRDLTPGLRVRVQFCTGPYGQTAQVTGRLDAINQYGGLSITLDHDYTHESGRFGCHLYKAGEPYCVGGVFERPENGVLRGFRRHEDFEHGHDVWVEVLA